MTDRVTVEELSIRSASGGRLLAPTSLRVPPGSITVLTGPSGSGKTTLLRAVLGHLADGTTRSGGSVHVGGQDVFALDPPALQAFRREHIAFVGQDPGAALNPRMRIRSLLREAAPQSGGPALVDALTRVGLPADYLRRRPRELSGGEQRRVALAVALVRKVGVLVVDEPLAGLHGQLRGEIADLLRALATDSGVAVLTSGHDMAAMHRIADDVIALGSSRAALQQLTIRLSDQLTPKGISLRARAVSARAGRRTLLDSVDLDIGAGECVALVGPSGAGKTTLARVLAGIHLEASGSVEVNGRPLAVGGGRRTRRDQRRIQLIPQNPLSTLNPKHTVLQTLSRPLRLTGMTDRGEIHARAAQLLDSVEMSQELLRHYPGELSGGQRQRVAIARALATEPDILLCDEITSALDADTAAAIMSLVERTRIERGIGVLVVSHDMAIVAGHCHRIVVLAEGAVVERGDTSDILAAPSTPETKALLV